MFQAFERNIDLDLSERRDGYLAGLFRGHDRDAVRFLADSERRAMTRAEFGDQQRIRRQRQEAGRGGNPVALNDHRSIVQSSSGMKNGAQQIAGDLRVQAYSA